MTAYLSVFGSHVGDLPTAGPVMVFDPETEKVSNRPDPVDVPSIVWTLTDEAQESADLSVAIEVDPSGSWVMRCDRIDFPPGGIAYTHTHPGPGIRHLLFGELTVTVNGEAQVYRPGDPWFESGPEPVLAVASDSEPTAFVRVLVLPAEWEGKRTIRYVNPEDEDRPKLQKATVYAEVPIEEIPGA